MSFPPYGNSQNCPQGVLHADATDEQICTCVACIPPLMDILQSIGVCVKRPTPPGGGDNGTVTTVGSPRSANPVSTRPAFLTVPKSNVGSG